MLLRVNNELIVDDLIHYCTKIMLMNVFIIQCKKSFKKSEKVPLSPEIQRLFYSNLKQVLLKSV